MSEENSNLKAKDYTKDRITPIQVQVRNKARQREES